MFNKLKQGLQEGAKGISSAAKDVQAGVKKGMADNNLSSPIPADLATECAKAAKILASFTDPEKVEGELDNIIPKRVILEAKGLAIFTVLKAGMLWSGRAGTGIVISRLADGSWSPPSCINIGGVGVGAQIGADLTEFVIILNTEDAVKAFSRGENVTLGGNLSVSAGPMGMGGEVAGTLAEGAAIYSYSRSKGLFAGMSVEGSVVLERKEANQTFYGIPDVRAEQILTGQVHVPDPNAVETLYEVISRAEIRPQ